MGQDLQLGESVQLLLLALCCAQGLLLLLLGEECGEDVGCGRLSPGLPHAGQTLPAISAVF